MIPDQKCRLDHFDVNDMTVSSCCRHLFEGIGDIRELEGRNYGDNHGARRGNGQRSDAKDNGDDGRFDVFVICLGGGGGSQPRSLRGRDHVQVQLPQRLCLPVLVAGLCSTMIVHSCAARAVTLTPSLSAGCSATSRGGFTAGSLVCSWRGSGTCSTRSCPGTWTSSPLKV